MWARFLILCLSTIVAATDALTTPKLPSHPNIIFILVDDLDQRLGSLDYQPAVRQHFREQGTYFEKHYCTIAVCCPSRVSLLTGKHAHNTNVTDVRLPFGGYPKFIQEGLNGAWLPSWFQQNSYNTYYTGKLMNNHSIINYDSPFPKGFNQTDYPNTYIYYNATMQSNRDAPRNVPGQYSTDVVARRALDFMDDATTSADPFFLTVAPIGPHGETIIPPTIPGQPRGRAKFNPPVAAEKYKHLYPGVKVPRTANFNPDSANGPSYFKGLRKWNQTVVDYYDEFHRARLQTLASVDDLIDLIVAKTESLGIVDNTYIIYTSDNGFHIGQHRLPAGKSCAIEEDINVPFFIRGPGIAKNITVKYPTSHVDIAPTLYEIAGRPLRPDFDGSPMPIWANQRRHDPNKHIRTISHTLARPLQQPNSSFTKHEHVNVEFWGANFGEGDYANELLDPTNNNNTYKSLRLISTDGHFNLAYMVWCTNERELYDMRKDSQQLDNLAVEFDHPSSPPPAQVVIRDVVGEPVSEFQLEERGPSSDLATPDSRIRLQARLDTLLMVLKTCKAETCREPWARIHPDGRVKSLADAMDRKYDQFYVQDQPKISFSSCAPGYLRGAEGPGDDQGDVKIWNDHNP